MLNINKELVFAIITEDLCQDKALCKFFATHFDLLSNSTIGTMRRFLSIFIYHRRYKRYVLTAVKFWCL